MSLTLDGTLGLNSINIGANIPGTGAFTTLNTIGNVTLGSSSGNTVTINAGTVTLNNSTTISAASTKTLTLNGGAGSNGLVIDASNNVGIGTTPAVRFTVSNNSSGAYVTSRIENLNTGGYAQQDFLIGAGGSAGQASVSYAPGIFFAIGPSANDTTTPIVFRNNNATAQMTLNASGNLGLGVTPSAWASTQKALEFNNGALFASSVAIDIVQNAYLNTSSSWIYKTAAQASFYQQYQGQHQWYTSTNTPTVGGTVTFNQSMTLDASGNLLVGPTSVAVNYPVSQIKSNIFTGNLTVSVAALNTNYGLSISVAAGILVIRDNTAGGSALWLLDPNGGALQISSNIGKTITFLYTGGQWVIKQTAGAVTTQYAYSVLSAA